MTQQELALERTEMAQERTLMAWLRTSLAMISFGFTLRHFFNLLLQEGHHHPVSVFGPRGYGVVMMIMGVLMLGMASVQHAQAMRRYRRSATQRTFSLALIFSLVTVLLGVAALLATLFEKPLP